MDQQKKIWAIIPAAGIGQRVASSKPKQYLSLAGKTVLEHSIERVLACERVSGLLVGIAPDDQYARQLNINHARFLDFYRGGDERIHTVLNGLEKLSTLANEADWVLVHDAARPCLTSADVDRLIEQGLNSTSGAILAQSVVDTVKQKDAGGLISQTLDRDQLALAQTPQLFPIQLLTKALKQSLARGQLSTDESAAVEAIGHKPLIVDNSRTNIKITVPEDIKLAEFILNGNKEL